MSSVYGSRLRIPFIFESVLDVLDDDIKELTICLSNALVANHGRDA